MDQDNHKRHLRRIFAGEVHCKINYKTIVLEPPTEKILSQAEVIYDDILYDSGFFAPSESNVLTYMIECGLWSDNDDQKIKTFGSTIEALKIEMWSAYLKFSSKRVDRCRKQIGKHTKEWLGLYSRRHIYDWVLARGIALLAKNEFLVSSLSTIELPPAIICAVTREYYTYQLNEDELRELARTPTARHLWSCSKAGSLYNLPANCWTDEQVGFVGWSRLYDNIYESPDCPPQVVIDDDLLLDGWLLVQANDREKEKENKLGEGFGDAANKHGKQEIFIPAETQDDAQRIHDMNDAQARFQKRQREQLIVKHGEISEQQMPDSQLLMRQQALQNMRDRSKR